MQRFSWNKGGRFAAVFGTALLAACAKAPPPPPPPPPPPMVIPVPAKPTPPYGASLGIPVPPTDANGLRRSVDRNITPAQMTWNLRSAFNVAALNCNNPKHAEILPNYKAFLISQSKVLKSTNARVDAEYRKTYGAKYIPYREAYMTSVYNHFALPPTLPAFCDAALIVGREALTIKPADLDAFSFRSLPTIEVVFDDFYRQYEQYLANLAAWQARYGPPPPAIVFQPVASGPMVQAAPGHTQ
ncbi:hypothetical protein [Novosphingobium lentum]|uniref:hypothetical protein n=1 Tax=Novosphingobium lentum TaxID=145287 RepID=UPI000830CBB5|nr:hypothetical protein [Novosphingobium lentum]